jgi:hypothetical protein
MIPKICETFPKAEKFTRRFLRRRSAR